MMGEKMALILVIMVVASITVGGTAIPKSEKLICAKNNVKEGISWFREENQTHYEVIYDYNNPTKLRTNIYSVETVYGSYLALAMAPRIVLYSHTVLGSVLTIKNFHANDSLSFYICLKDNL